jgi:hypothetical protein
MSNLGRRCLRGLPLALFGTLAVAAGLGMTPMQFGAPRASTEQNPPLSRHSDDEIPSATQEMQEHQIKRLREEHQKELLTDTARLLQLATALKSEVDEGSKPTPEELKNVDEMVRLAKRVSERIKTQ